MPVVLHLLAELPGLRRGLVMVQAEVAERLAAPPGSRAYGVPSAKLAWYAAARRAGPVPRTVFWPVPNVDSGLLAFERRDPPPGRPRGGVPRDRRGVRPAAQGVCAPAWRGGRARRPPRRRPYAAAGIAPLARAETLGIADFARLAAASRLSTAAAEAEALTART